MFGKNDNIIPFEDRSSLEIENLEKMEGSVICLY